MFVSSFHLTPCVCFYVLCRSAMSPSFGIVALCSKCPVRASGIFSIFTGARSSRVSLMWVVCPPIVTEPWLLFGCHWVGLTLRLTGWEGWLWLQCTRYGTGAGAIKSDLLQQGCGASWVHPSCVSFVALVGWCSGMVWSQPLVVLALVRDLSPPLLPVSWLLFVSLVIGILFSSSSGVFQWWLFYNFVVILLWSWKEVSTGIVTGS